MYKIVSNSKLPKFLKILIYILLTLTCIYWIGYFTYKILDFIRIFLNYISSKEHWWAFLICFSILGIGTFLIAEFVFDLGWWENIENWFIGIIKGIEIWFKEILLKLAQ